MKKLGFSWHATKPTWILISASVNKYLLCTVTVYQFNSKYQTGNS